MPDSLPFWVVIPARRASTRLPNKPLADIHGKPMVVRVAQRAAQSRANRVIVATDDQQILDAVKAHGFEAMMTRADHASGTDRISEVAAGLNAGPEQILVNVQGDEPFIEPELIDQVARGLDLNPQASVCTAAAPIQDHASLSNPNVVKLTCDQLNQALYFSRSPIPFHRDHWSSLQTLSLTDPPLMRHIGIYAFRAKCLAQFVGWPESPLEKTERLEQLRWLWMGRRIAVCMLQRTPSPGVDTEEDLHQARMLWPTMGSL